MDPYKILEIPYNSTITDINNAYKVMAKKLHPDRAQKSGYTIAEATKRFQELQAYEGEPSLAVALKAIKALKNVNDVVHDRPIRKINMYVLKENPVQNNKSFFEIIWVDST